MMAAAVLALAGLLGACTSETVQSTSEEAPDSSTASPTRTARTPASSSGRATPSASADAPTVVIRDNSFGPPMLTVAVGDVIFVNADTVPHTVTEGVDGAAAPDARFNVVVPAGESKRVSFDKPGAYLITCLFHSEMRLMVHAH